MTNKFVSEAQAPQRILISVRIAGKRPEVAETSEQLVQSRYLQISKIAYLSNLSIDQVGKLLVALREAQSSQWSRVEAIRFTAKFVSNYPKIASTGSPSWIARRILRTFANLGLIDNEAYITSYGIRLCKAFLDDKERCKDTLAQLLLVSGGWVAILTELKTLYEEHMANRMKDLLELLHDRLEQAGFISGKWSSQAMIEVLLDLNLINEWDGVMKRYPINWDRTYALMKSNLAF